MSQSDTVKREHASGHGQGLGSGSGAGRWLAGPSSSPSTSAPLEVGGGRKFHISAEASTPTTSTPNGALLVLNQSGSGEVDLDLSFDYVSQMQSDRAEKTPLRNEGGVPTTTTASSNNEPAKGMSSARWASRPRKQPPSALLLHNNKKAAMHLTVDSQFSPISPLVGKNDNLQPLVVTPLSATRRANDAGIQPPVNKLELIRQQRLVAKQKQNDDQEELRLLSLAKKSETSSPHRKAALGENRSRNNIQILPSNELGDVFDDASYDYKKHLKKTTSLASMRTGGAISSFATAAESQGVKTRRRKREKGSMESVKTFDTALSITTDEIPAIDVQPPQPSDGGLNMNMLGLELNESKLSGLGLLFPDERSDSHQEPQFSSPISPISPPLSESDTFRGSEYTQSTGTPGTAFSTLFEDQAYDHKAMQSAQMTRGYTAPFASAPTVQDVIEEEESTTLIQVRTAPAAAFRIELPEVKDALAPRSRQTTNTSTLESLPDKEAQTMIVSTTSSPVEEVEFLFRKPSVARVSEEHRQASGARAGPWPQSPLLLSNFPEADVSDEHNVMQGLGIDLGKSEEVNVPHNMSDLSVERALSPLGDGGAKSEEANHPTSLAPPPEKEAMIIKTSPSFVSSVEGFAINVTQPDRKSEVPAEVVQVVESEEVEKIETQSRGRWSTKLWSMASKSPLSAAFRSSSHGRTDQDRNPTMKPLMLVNRKEGEEEQKGNRHSRSRSKDDVSDRLPMERGDGYHSMPSSAVLPDVDTFASLQMPAQALFNEPRSSKHVKRTSRLRYVPSDLDHVQIDMGDNSTTTTTTTQRQAASTLSPLDDFKSPRVAQSPSGLTPKMEYLFNTKSNRNSWSHASSSVNTGTPFWLAPKRQSVTFKRDSDMFLFLRNSTLSAIEADQQEENKQVSSSSEDQMIETIVEDGIRRRGNHRVANSVPSTPTMTPEVWNTPFPETERRRQEEEPPLQSTTHSNHSQVPARQITMKAIPASTIIRPYLVGLVGSRNRTKMVKSSNAAQRRRMSLFTDHQGGPEGFFAYSGRALESIKPSRALFFAGFLAMPWLWFIGGWGLELDGSVYTDRGFTWDSFDEEAILLELLQKQAIGQRLLARDDDGRRHYNRGGGVQNRRSRSALARPESIINMEEGDDQQQSMEVTNRLHSLDLQQADNQSGIAYSTEGNEAAYWHNDLGIHLPVSHNPSNNDDEKQSKKKKKTLFQQVVQVNTTLMARLTSSNSNRTSLSMYSQPSLHSDKRQQQRHQQGGGISSSINHKDNHHHNTTSLRNSALVTAFTNWTKLEPFVLCNRIMALFVSIFVFGGFAVAIVAVINNW